MDYIGSKEKLNEWMFEKITTAKPSGVFLDACAGSGSVSRYASKLGFTVVANDLLEFSAYCVLGSAGLKRELTVDAMKHIYRMNLLKGIDGFFYQNFSEQSGRLYFSDDNAQKIDACRLYIDTVQNSNIKSYLLYCLIEAVSRVLNTTGVQAAFLKRYKERANRKLVIKAEYSVNHTRVYAYTRDILELLKDKSFRNVHSEDILYIDPPYNQRQYGPNYHLYETLVRNDNPQLKGKTGLRNDWKVESGSKFCTKSQCLKFLKDVIDATVAPLVFISYSSDGIINPLEMEDFILKEVGCKAFSKHVCLQKRYKSDNSDDRTYNQSILKEYLFELHL